MNHGLVVRVAIICPRRSVLQESRRTEGLFHRRPGLPRQCLTRAPEKECLLLAAGELLLRVRQ